MTELSAYPAYRRTPDRLMLVVSEHLCYSWEYDGDPGALRMVRVIGAANVCVLEYGSAPMTEAEFREAVHERLDETLDYITKMAK